MVTVGLTGGIGSGKSEVARALGARGAAVIDADAVARQVVEPGTTVHAALVARFGTGILDADGAIDRRALAAIVFGDADALEALNGITHPAIGAELFRLKEEHAGTDRLVVIEIPLLTAAHRATLGLAAVVVVDVDPAVALSRLVDQRGMDPADAAARMAAQMDRSARLALADLVVDNSGDRDHLEAEVDRLWAELSVLGAVARRHAPADLPPPG
jgi:dephospho-CoA kinase